MGLVAIPSIAGAQKERRTDMEDDMDLRMTIEQGDNGWVLRYTGHDCLDKVKICSKWSDVKRELNEYFGWWNTEGKHSKTNPYL